MFQFVWVGIWNDLHEIRKARKLREKKTLEWYHSLPFWMRWGPAVIGILILIAFNIYLSYH